MLQNYISVQEQTQTKTAIFVSLMSSLLQEKLSSESVYSILSAIRNETSNRSITKAKIKETVFGKPSML